VELRHLRYLVAIADEKSFVAAAASLRVAQPALSRQIKDLEEEVGEKLLEREASGSSLTSAGEAVVAIGRNILHSVEAALERARLTEHGLIGRCVISVGRYPVAFRLVARLIEQLRAEYPGIEVVVDNQSHQALWDAINAAQVDIGLGTMPPTTDLQLAVETVARDALDTAVLPSGHRLAKKKQVKLEDLRDETFIGLGPSIGSEPSELLRKEFAARDFKPAAIRDAANRDGISILIRAGAGWTTIPRSFGPASSPGLALVPIADLSVPFRYVHVHRRSEDRPVVLSVLNTLRRLAREESEKGGEAATDKRTLPPDERTGRASRVELRHLRYLVAAIDHESIGRAAEALGLTQPALSRQIRDLEEEVGATLITRTTRGVAATLVGESLRSDARRILTAASRLGSEAKRAVRGSQGRVVIGAAASAMSWDILTRAVAALSSADPDADLHVEDVPTPRQAIALRDARLDVAIGHRFPSSPEIDDSVVRLALLPDSLDAALLPEDHPLARRREIDVADLGRLQFLFIKREFSPALYDVVMSELAALDYTPRVGGTYDAMPSIWAMVAQGLGWGLAATSQQARPPLGLVAVPLKGFSVPWGCELAYRRGEARPSVLAMIDAIRDAAHAVEKESMTSPAKKYWPKVGRAG
jgi:DNA-binding transcriptional LysR family regulator